MSFTSLQHTWLLRTWGVSGMGGQCSRFGGRNSKKGINRESNGEIIVNNRSEDLTDGKKHANGRHSGKSSNPSLNKQNLDSLDKSNNVKAQNHNNVIRSSLDNNNILNPDEKIVSRDTTADDNHTGTPVGVDDIQMLQTPSIDFDGSGDTQDFVSTCSNDIGKDTRPSSKDLRSATSNISDSKNTNTNPTSNPNQLFSFFGSTHNIPAYSTSGKNFHVRNSGYKKTKEKVPSGESLYTFFGCDFVKADHTRIENMVDNWGHEFVGRISNHISARDSVPRWSENCGLPEILVINCMCPYETGGMWGSHPVDDLGFNVLTYHYISPDTLKAAKSGKLTRSMELFRRFIESGKSDRNGISLKKIGQAANVEDLGLPGFIKGYNGKPVLVTASCNVIKSQCPRILELDYDIRQWSYAMRSALPGTVFPRFKIAEILLGWLIEGKTEDELPEQMLACCSASCFDVQDFPLVAGR